MNRMVTLLHFAEYKNFCQPIFFTYPPISRLKGKKKTGVGWCFEQQPAFYISDLSCKLNTTKNEGIVSNIFCQIQSFVSSYIYILFVLS